MLFSVYGKRCQEEDLYKKGKEAFEAIAQK